MTNDAPPHTSWREGVPDFGDKAPEELCRYICQDIPDHPLGNGLSSRHYTELCLAIAKLLDEKEGHEIPSGDIYDEVSSECKKAIKALDGALTRGVTAARMSSRQSHKALLRRDSNSESYLDSNGEKRWRPKTGTGTTRWEVHYLIDHLYEYAEAWGTSPTIMAAAAEQCVNENNSALLDSLARPKFSISPNSHDPQGWRGECPDEADESVLVRRGPDLDDLLMGTNGLDNTPADDPENRRSERSDGKNEVDQNLANPPVEVNCNRRQWRWLTSRARSISEQWQFLKVVNSRRKAAYGSGEEDDDWTVMTSKTLRREYNGPAKTERIWRGSVLIKAWKGGRYISPEEAEARGIDPQARKFKPKEEALEKWTRLGAEGGSYRYKAHCRELVRTSPPSALKTDLSDDNNHAYPELIDRAIRILKEADHELILGAIEDAEEAIVEKEGAEARASLTSLRLAKETVKRQVIQVQDGVAELQNAYEVQEISGRTGFKMGGPQGLMGEVKAMAYDIDELRNYDIKSCHTSALRQAAEKLEQVGVDIDLSPWEDYPGKYEVADDTGLPVSLIKIVEHAVKYGAVIPLSISQAEDYYEEVCGYKISIAEEVKKHAEKGLIDDPDEALRTLYDVFEPMRKVVKRIAKALLDDYYHAKRRGAYMHNACGISFCPGRHTEGHDREAAVMAWMLQGLEAAFIHSLTILGDRSDDFDVIANEHDGCIVKGEIPHEAIEVARHMSGFHEAELAKKDFADEEDVEELYSTPDEEDGEEETPSARNEDTKTTDPRSAASNRGGSLSREEKARLEQQYDGGRAVGGAPERGTGVAERQTSTPEPRSETAQSKSGGAERERSSAEIGMPEPEEVKLE